MDPFKVFTIKYLTENNEEHETDVNLYNYTDRSIALQGTEHFGKSFTDEFIKINGKYNPKLKIGSGWVFSNKKEEVVIELINKIGNKEIKGIVPKIYPKSNQEPVEVIAFRNIFKSLSDVKTDVEVHMSSGQTFIWGKKDKVETMVKTLNKNIFSEFRLGDTCMVLCL